MSRFEDAPDPDAPDPDAPDLDDPAHAALRDQLAEARVTSPVPAEVAASLDATLAGLLTERAAGTAVVPLRRRRAPRFLAAAAAVVLLGAGAVGLTQVLRDSDTRSDSATAADRSAAGQAVTPGLPGVATGLDAEDLAALGQVSFTRTGFARQVARYLHTEAGYAAAQPDAPTPAPTSAPTSASAKASCPGPPVTDGAEVVGVRYQRRPAALVVHPPVAGARFVAVWSCDGTRQLDSATVTH